MPARYVPDSGDIVWLNFDPQTGHEQAGHRPAVVLTPSRYNENAGLMLCCPMTTKIKNYTFEVLISGKPVSVALSDQVKSLDWRARKATRKGKVTPLELAEIRGKVHALVG